MTDLVRAYINLDPDDKATLERHYGHGWSERMRDLISKHCRDIRMTRLLDKVEKKHRTVGDAFDD